MGKPRIPARPARSSPERVPQERARTVGRMALRPRAAPGALLPGAPLSFLPRGPPGRAAGAQQVQLLAGPEKVALGQP